MSDNSFNSREISPLIASVTLGGASPVQNVDFKFIKYGKMVNMIIPNFTTLAIASTFMSVTAGIPSIYFPAEEQNQFAYIQNNGILVVGSMQFLPTGEIRFYRSANRDAFSFGQTIGFFGSSITYRVD